MNNVKKLIWRRTHIESNGENMFWKLKSHFLKTTYVIGICRHQYKKVKKSIFFENKTKIRNKILKMKMIKNLQKSSKLK